MTDLEERLTSSLRSAGDAAPDAAGLAPAARARAGSRRRRTALSSAVGVVAVAAVVGGVALLGSGGDGGTPAVADDPTPLPSTRVETWRDVSVTVPASWGHGNLDDWCSGEQGRPPVVERPDAVSIDILCTPMYGYGVQFSEAPASGFEAFSPGTVNESVGEDYPDGSWQGWDQAGTTRVLVVAPTRAEAEQVLGSFAEVTGTDANGCVPRDSNDEPAVPPTGLLRLCHYGPDGWLVQSEILRGDDAREAVTALAAMPTGTADCTEPAESAVTVTGADLSGAVLVGPCPSAIWNGTSHIVTANALHWVLSPGWTGQVPDGISFEPRR
jgi:hypothetical protein